jgi:hypothetical protein
MFESCAWDGVARRRICGAGANSAGAGRDAGEVVTAGVDDDEAELVWASLLSMRRGPRGGLRLRSHQRREWNGQGTMSGPVDGKLSTLRQVLEI